MLACGRFCQPSQIIRELESLDSSTRPILVKTDCSIGYIKATNNPAGTVALASELLAAELGTWMGLRIPNFAVVRQCEIELTLYGTNVIAEPPFFFSEKIEAEPYTGSDWELELVAPKSDIARLVVFDTWIRNWDRYDDRDHGSNRDNLLMKRDFPQKRVSMIPIDHSHAFVDVGFDEDLPDENLTRDAAIFGKFPAFDNFLDESSVYEATNHLNELTREFVEDCVNNIPAEWKPSNQTCSAMIDFLLHRAEFIAQELPQRLLHQPRLPGVQ